MRSSGEEEDYSYSLRCVPLLYLVECKQLLLNLLSLRVRTLPTKSKLHHFQAGKRGGGRGNTGGGRRGKHGDNKPGSPGTGEAVRRTRAMLT